MHLILYAANIHQGGGKVLFSSLLDALSYSKLHRITAFIDDRLTYPTEKIKNINIIRVKPTIAARFHGELQLKRLSTNDDIVLCFGNLPPLLSNSAKVFVYLQNRYLIKYHPLQHFPLSTRLRIIIERAWLKYFIRKSNILVQTKSMARDFQNHFNITCDVLPFVPNDVTRNSTPSCSKNYKKSRSNYLYIASGEPHKNHLPLIEAWCLLAEEGLFPSLYLTLDEVIFSGLCNKINIAKQQFKLKIKNVGAITHQEVLVLYKNTDALIYPSSFESFGLPLIEANQAGLPILASELDYVRDILDPEQTFNPESPISIAKAVKRFMGVNESPFRLLNATQFLTSILESAK